MDINAAIHKFNWCIEHNHKIDYELVKEMKPDCIVANNGCGNCPKCTYKSLIKTAEALIFREADV